MLAELEGNNVVLQSAAVQKRAAVAGGLLLEWHASLVACARREQAADDAAARRVSLRLASLAKPRQGYTKPLMRLLTVRLCCVCRALQPRCLLWRVVQLNPRTKPPAAGLSRYRTVRRRWRVLRVPKCSADAASKPPSRALIARLPGGASEALQSDEEVWTKEGPVHGVRSVHVCRTLLCVRAALKRKALPKALGCAVSQPLLDALLAATQLEAAAASEAAARGEPPPGVTAEEWRKVELLMPRIAPVEGQRGPHDKLIAPPGPPK